MNRIILRIGGQLETELLIDAGTFGYQGGYLSQSGMIKNSAISFCLANPAEQDAVISSLRTKLTRYYSQRLAEEMAYTRQRLNDGRNEIILFLPAGTATTTPAEFSFKTPR